MIDVPASQGPADADIYAPAFVRDLFDRCSGRYRLFSLFFSFGFTERWRRKCVAALPAESLAGASGYDLMAGTGEIWPHLLRRYPDIASITAIDISSGMHQRALARLHAVLSRLGQARVGASAHKIAFIEDDVLASRLPDASADFIVSTFGLKTFNESQHRALAALTARVLKPGGVFAMIEASDPKGWLLRPLYLFHLRRVLPLIERQLARKRRTKLRRERPRTHLPPKVDILSK